MSGEQAGVMEEADGARVRVLAGRIARGLLAFASRLALVSALLWASWLSLGAVLQWPARSPVAAEAVVVLGGDSGIRYQKGRALVLAGYADTLLLIRPHKAALKDLAATVRNVAVHTEESSDSSWSEAQNTLAWMRAQGIAHVLVVSDPPHMLRLAYTWWSVFRGTGLRYTLVMTQPSWWSAWNWWHDERAALFAGTELLKLVYYVVRYRFGWGG